jgi:hypothetical protein
MEKLEESETKRRLSIKGTIVTISAVVSRTFHEYMVILHYIWCITVLLSWLVFPLSSGWLFVVWVYLQARQNYVQQISSLHIMDSYHVRIPLIKIKHHIAGFIFQIYFTSSMLQLFFAVCISPYVIALSSWGVLLWPFLRKYYYLVTKWFRWFICSVRILNSEIFNMFFLLSVGLARLH